MIGEAICRRPDLLALLVCWACLWTGIGLGWLMWRLEAHHLTAQLKESNDSTKKLAECLLEALRKETASATPVRPPGRSDA